MPLFGPNITKMTQKGDTQGLMRVLQHNDMALRVEAANALGQLKYTPGILDALNNDYPDVRSVAVAAVKVSGKLGDSNVINALKNVLIEERNEGLWQNVFSLINNSGKIDIDTWEKIATGLLKNKRFKAALNCLDKMADMGQDKTTLSRISTVLMMHERYEDALKYGEMLTQIEPEDAGIWKAQADLLYLADRYDDALKCGQKALEINPSLDSVRDTMIGVYLHKEDFSSAASMAMEALKVNPDNILSRITLTDCLKAMDKLIDAESGLKAALDVLHKEEYIQPEFPGLIYSKLGIIQAMRGYKEEALTSLEKAVEADPTDASYQELLVSLRILDIVGIVLKGTPQERESRITKFAFERQRARRGEGLSETEMSWLSAFSGVPSIARIEGSWDKNLWTNDEWQSYVIRFWPPSHVAAATREASRLRISEAFQQGIEEILQRLSEKVR